MSNEATTPPSASAIAEENDALDQLILGREYPPALVHIRPPAHGEDPEPWTIAEQLAHIGEFQGFFSRQLEVWLSDPATEIGRTHEHDERLAAVTAAAGRHPNELLDDVRASAETLASTLARLDDEHLAMSTNNVKYGAEPLTAFLQRYVIGHKRAHAEQIGNTLKAVAATLTLGSGTRTLGTP